MSILFAIITVAIILIIVFMLINNANRKYMNGSLTVLGDVIRGSERYLKEPIKVTELEGFNMTFSGIQSGVALLHSVYLSETLIEKITAQYRKRAGVTVDKTVDKGNRSCYLLQVIPNNKKNSFAPNWVVSISQAPHNNLLVIVESMSTNRD